MGATLRNSLSGRRQLRLTIGCLSVKASIARCSLCRFQCHAGIDHSIAPSQNRLKSHRPARQGLMLIKENVPDDSYWLFHGSPLITSRNMRFANFVDIFRMKPRLSPLSLAGHQKICSTSVRTFLRRLAKVGIAENAFDIQWTCSLRI